MGEGANALNYEVWCNQLRSRIEELEKEKEKHGIMIEQLWRLNGSMVDDLTTAREALEEIRKVAQEICNARRIAHKERVFGLEEIVGRATQALDKMNVDNNPNKGTIVPNSEQSTNDAPNPTKTLIKDGKIVNCTLCGTPCRIAGEVTHYYEPIEESE